MTHQDYKEMIPAHALSALDVPENRALMEHLNSCAECRLEFDQWLETASSLSLGAEAAEPSPRVREHILREIRNQKDVATDSRVIPFVQPRTNFWSSFGSLGAIAASLLFVALLVYAVLLWRENRALKDSVRSLAVQVEATQRKLKLEELVETPGSQFAELKGMPVVPDAMAKLAYDHSGHAMVMAKGLPAPPADKEYQLWFMVANKPPMRGKTFSTDSQGKAMLEDQIPTEAMKAAVFAITLEPKGGSDVPTMPIYLRS